MAFEFIDWDRKNKRHEPESSHVLVYNVYINGALDQPDLSADQLQEYFKACCWPTKRLPTLTQGDGRVAVCTTLSRQTVAVQAIMRSF